MLHIENTTKQQPQQPSLSPKIYFGKPTIYFRLKSVLLVTILSSTEYYTDSYIYS